MEHGDLRSGFREPLPEGGVHEAGPAQQQDKENYRAEGVEHQVDEARPPGVGPGSG